jgi:AraC-like DNA-binding protein
MGNWIHAIIRTLDALGFQGVELALEAGISPRTIRSPHERAPQIAVTALWQRAVEVTRDPCFGLHVPRHATVATFGALGYALYASPDLRSGFGRIVRYQKAVSDAAELRVVEGDDRYGFAIDVTSEAGPPYEAVDAFFALLTRLVRGLAGNQHRVEPIRVCMRRPEPSPSDLFRRIFRAPVVFGAPRNLLEYSKRDFELRLPDANLELAQENDQIVARQLAGLDRRTFAEQVHAILLETLPDGPTTRTVAKRLSMSTSSLQAFLAREGKTYKEVLNRAREELAVRYLEDNRYSIKEIAFLLGFSDVATFSRAFKRWTGRAPKYYGREEGGPRALD